AVAAERDRQGLYASIRELAQRSQLSEHALETLIVAGACDCFAQPRRSLLWELGMVPRTQSVPGSGGEERQLALPLDPTAATPDLPEPTVCARTPPYYPTTSLSVAFPPRPRRRPPLPATALSSDCLHRARNRSSL